MVYHWNHVLDRLDVCNTVNRNNRTVLPYPLDVREVQSRKVLDERARGTDDVRESLLLLAGDREVLCLASPDGMQLWFFNPGFLPDLPDAMPFLAAE